MAETGFGKLFDVIYAELSSQLEARGIWICDQDTVLIAKGVAHEIQESAQAKLAAIGREVRDA